jgi:hypothetical protein
MCRVCHESIGDVFNMKYVMSIRVYVLRCMCGRVLTCQNFKNSNVHV